MVKTIRVFVVGKVCTGKTTLINELKKFQVPGYEFIYHESQNLSCSNHYVVVGTFNSESSYEYLVTQIEESNTRVHIWFQNLYQKGYSLHPENPNIIYLRNGNMDIDNYKKIFEKIFMLANCYYRLCLL